MASHQAAGDEGEARGRDLLAVAIAWPLGGHIRRWERWAQRRFHFVDRLDRKSRAACFVPHDFRPDRISAWVVERNKMDASYAATFRVKNDLDLPGDVLDAVKHNHQPQFTLRNIGRAERNDVDPKAPLPLQIVASQQLDAMEEVSAARATRLPKVEPIEIWTSRMVVTLRLSMRRLLMEDPWDQRYGAEIRANFGGRAHEYVVEGTHPDDAPGAWWGPAPIPVPVVWAQPPAGGRGEEHALSLHDVIRIVSGGKGG